MKVAAFFDKDTYTLTYIAHREGGREAIIIDPVWDLDTASGRLEEASVHKVLAYLSEHDLTPQFVLETHAHADHLTGAQLLKQKFPQLKVGISQRIRQVQDLFAKLYNIESQVPATGEQFDHLFADHEELEIAGLKVKVLPTPGHTPACSSYLIEDAVFTGDALFMPDYGTGRCDFPAGSARDLYHSITNNLYTLPDATRVFVGHDYQPNDRPLVYESTIGAEKADNIQLRADTTEEQFVSYREARDKTLAAPKLLLPSLQVNIRAGHLPEPEANGKRYLKLPLKTDS